MPPPMWGQSDENFRQIRLPERQFSNLLIYNNFLYEPVEANFWRKSNSFLAIAGSQTAIMGELSAQTRMR